MTQFRKKPVVIDAVRWRGYSSNLGITEEPADMPVEITHENMHNIKWGLIPDWLPKPLPEVERYGSGEKSRVGRGKSDVMGKTS